MTVMGQAPKPIVLPETWTRVLGLPLAGVLSLGALWRSRLIWRDRSETAAPIQGMARADDGGGQRRGYWRDRAVFAPDPRLRTAGRWPGARGRTSVV